MQAIEYSLKYRYKGADQVTVTSEDNAAAGCIAQQEAVAINEIKEFQSKQHVSGAEAAWCQCQNEVADRKPAVYRLQLHLPGDQTVYFDSNKKDESTEQIEQAEQIKLTSFFELSCHDKFAQTLLYWQIPEHYTWNTKQRKWKRRKKVLRDDHMPYA